MECRTACVIARVLCSPGVVDWFVFDCLGVVATLEIVPLVLATGLWEEPPRTTLPSSHLGEIYREHKGSHEIMPLVSNPLPTINKRNETSKHRHRYMDELTIMEVPEPPSMGTTGSLLMEQIPKVRESLTRGHDWDGIVLKATSPSPPDGSGTFCTYDDADDPDVKSVAALFAAGEHEQWGNDAASSDATPSPAAPRAPSAAAIAAVEAARAAQAEEARGKRGGGGGGGGGGMEKSREEAPASSVGV